MTEKFLTVEEVEAVKCAPFHPRRTELLAASHEALRATLVHERALRAATERRVRRAMACLRDVARAVPHKVLAELEKQLDEGDRPVVGGDDSVGLSIGGSLGVGPVDR